MLDDAPLSSSPKRPSWCARLMAALVLMVAIAGAVVALMALNGRDTKALPSDQPAPLPVTTADLQLETSYPIVRRFIGRLEAAQETNLAFEQSGLIEALLVDEGAIVEAGQVLARLDTDLLATERRQLLAELATIDADIELAVITSDRRRTLKNRGFESGQSYDEARLAVTRARAVRVTTEARLDRLDVQLEKSVLRAPYAGRIAERFRDEGAVVEMGMPVLHLQAAAAPRARIGIPPEVATGLSVGQEVSIHANGKPYQGKLIGISPDLDTTTRTVAALVELTSLGMPASGTIARLELEQTIQADGAWVPLLALQEGERGLWQLSLVKQNDGRDTVARTLVEILHIRDDQAFVRGSLIDGMQIINQGPHRINQGRQIVSNPAVEG